MEEDHLDSLPICKQQVLFPFISFSRFRCFCSRKSYSRKAKRMGWKLEKTEFLSLAERRRKRKSSYVVVKIVVRLFDCNQFQQFSQSSHNEVVSSLTNVKNHTFHFHYSFDSNNISNYDCSHLHQTRYIQILIILLTACINYISFL